MSTPPKTGWPTPELAQDDHRGLFRWFSSKPDARVRVREALPSCCEFHGMPEGCREGKGCPCRIDLRAIATRRVQESEARWTDGIGYEAGDPARVQREPLPVQFAGREPFDWQLIVIWIAVCVCIAALYALSIADPRDLSTIWPRLVALASF